MATTTVTSKGQATIPKRVRDILGVGPGDAVEFALEPDGRVVVTKAGEGATAAGARAASRFDRLRGSATSGLTTDEIMALMRGEVDEAHEDAVAARMAELLREER